MAELTAQFWQRKVVLSELQSAANETNERIKSMRLELATMRDFRGDISPEIINQLSVEAQFEQAIALTRIADHLAILTTPERERQEIERRRDEGLAATMEASKRFSESR